MVHNIFCIDEDEEYCDDDCDCDSDCEDCEDE